MGRELRTLLLLAAILAVGALGWRLLFGRGAGDRLVVTDVRGDVRVSDVPAEPGRVLGPADRLTAGASSSAVLALGAETRVVVDEGSSLRVLGVDATGVRLELEGGRVHATVRPGSGAVGIAADDREATATDATFTVARGEDGTFAVATERGAVELRNVTGLPSLAAGERVVVPGGGGDPLRAPVSDALLLQVAWPTARRTRETEVEIEGTTEPGASVELGREGARVRVRAGRDGRFRARVPLAEGENAVDVRATSVLGQTAEVATALVRDTTAPSIGVEIRY